MTYIDAVEVLRHGCGVLSHPHVGKEGSYLLRHIPANGDVCAVWPQIEVEVLHQSSMYTLPCIFC